MNRKIFTTLLVVALLAIAVSSSWAVSGYVSSFTSTYPSSATASFSCSICHTSVPARNAYGTAYANAGHNYRSIESQDSDGDGSNNITEINAGTNPGDAASKPAAPPPPAACTYTYSAWGACQSNGTQTRTVVSSSPAGCVGTPVLSQTCTYVPPVTACTSWTYSAWGACQPNGTQTRTVTSSSPAGCTGNPPASQLTQACTYVPPTTACTSWTYSAWGACQQNNTQTRTVTSSSPAGCTGNPPASQLTQACTYVPPTTACTSYTYTLGACQSDGTAPVTSAVGVPAGCSGGVTPATSQPCTYVPPTPPPTTGSMPVPTSEQTFAYDAVAEPVVNSDPSLAKPMGLGSVASGGDTVDLKVNVGPFAGPVDISLVIYAPAVDADELFYLGPDMQLKSLSEAVDEEQERAQSRGGYYTAFGSRDRGDSYGSSGRFLRKKFRRLVLWQTNVTQVNQEIFTVNVKDLPRGVYSFSLTAAASGADDDDDNYYRWVTQFVVKKRSSDRHDD